MAHDAADVAALVKVIKKAEPNVLSTASSAVAKVQFSAAGKV